MSITKLDCMELQDTRYSVYPYDGYNLEEILGKFYEAIKECNDLSFSLQEFNQWILSQGLAEEVLKQLSKVDWDNVVNSELYQKVLGDLNKAKEQLDSIETNSATKQELDVERKRMDSFTSLPSGSTAGDAELMDGRVGADGKTYSNIGGAIRGQFSNIDCNLNSVINAVYNYEQIEVDIKKGYYDELVFTENDNYDSAIVKCNEGENFSVSGYINKLTKQSLIKFISGNTIIARTPVITEDTNFEDYTFKIPKNCTSFLVQSYSANGIHLKVKKGVYDTKKYISDYLEPNLFENKLIDVSKKNGYYYNLNNVATFVESPNFTTTVLDVKKFEKYYLSMFLLGVGRLPSHMLCDDDFNVIEQGEIISTDTQINDLKVTIPGNVTKLIVSSYALKGGMLIVKKSLAIRSLALEKPLANYKYIVFGDSITELSYRWRDEFINITGATELKCYAVSGAHLCDYPDTVLNGNPNSGVASDNTICNQVYKMILNPPNETPDFVLISAFTNDFLEKDVLENRQLPNFQNNVGEYRSGKSFIPIDSVNRTQVDGAMRWQAEKIWSVYPDTKIIFIAPIQSADSNTRPTWSILAKGDLMEYVSNNLGCKTIKAGAECGIYANREIDGQNGKYLEDGLHTNIEGGKVLGNYNAIQVINFMKG